MAKVIKLGNNFKVLKGSDTIELFERVSINTVIVFIIIISMLYHFQWIGLPIGISLLLIIISSIIFNKCTVLDIKNGIIEKKLMISDMVLINYSVKHIGKNYWVNYEVHKNAVNSGSFIILYYLILKSPETHIETVLIKLRSEKDAIELKKLIDESKDSLN
jgi:acetyltransferase-like isoleucine patch superfamily enzyme